MTWSMEKRLNTKKKKGNQTRNGKRREGGVEITKKNLGKNQRMTDPP